LVLKDEPLFNGVKVASDGRILGFSGGSEQQLAFTGIHVLERRVLAGIPAGTPSSIIDCYLQLIARGEKVMAHVVEDESWGACTGISRCMRSFSECQELRCRDFRLTAKQ
jgi:NDP-sugar pyrophosphorylase family protein